MGVDFYPCEICGEVFSDAGHHGNCGNCEATLCGKCFDEMRKLNGELGEEHERAGWYGAEAPKCCDLCDGTIINKDKFILFLAQKIGKTVEELENEFRNTT